MSGTLKNEMPPDRSMFRSTPPSACATVGSEDSTPDGLVRASLDDRATPSTSSATQTLVVPQSSPESDQLRGGTSSVSTSSHHSSEHASLADMYLDTMIPDDHWRAACLRRIHQNQRNSRLNVDTKRISHRRSPALAPSPKFSKIVRKKEHSSIVKSMSIVKPKMAPPTPPVSPKKQSPRKLSSSGSSDSGFVSSSPSPCPLPYLRIRSTRNRPISLIPETISLDIPASMVGRSCLSCGCTTTTCWRRTLGGIICNSCGLRLFQLSPELILDTRNAVLSVRM